MPRKVNPGLGIDGPDVDPSGGAPSRAPPTQTREWKRFGFAPYLPRASIDPLIAQLRRPSPLQTPAGPARGVWVTRRTPTAASTASMRGTLRGISRSQTRDGRPNAPLLPGAS